MTYLWSCPVLTDHHKPLDMDMDMCMEMDTVVDMGNSMGVETSVYNKRKEEIAENWDNDTVNISQIFPLEI